MTQATLQHLPVTAEECRKRGWNYVDIVLISGDAYIDHPSFGIALVGRLLEYHGFRVAILPQPRYHNSDDFKIFGKPRLFFGITAGNLDSIVANYSSHGKVRDFDAYSDGGNPWWPGEKTKLNRRRPDRASIIYAQLARAAYRDVPIVLGGVEASLRRFVHYDYKQNRLRGSVLADSKSDLLIYGMGERAIVDTAKFLDKNEQLRGIKGTCERLTENQFAEFKTSQSPGSIKYLPSWDDIQKNKQLFLDAELLLDNHARTVSADFIAQKQQSSWIIQNAAPATLTPKELDAVYSLPFTRKSHPSAGDIPAYRMICHSVTIVRGCSGNCSFCAITRHQGPEIVSRSKESVLHEVQSVTQMDDFSGTISDLGGPTANLYATHCQVTSCRRHDCLYPQVCKHLQIDENKMIDLLESVSSVEKVKHVFISSGLRMELLLKTPKLLQKIIANHTPGSLKIAPEHTEDGILSIMHKESHSVLQQFVKHCKNVGNQLGRQPIFTPYIITGHPGSTEEDTHNLVKKMTSLGLSVRKFQDFTPTPGTLSTAMYVSGLDRQKKKIIIPAPAQKNRQRLILEKAFHKRQLNKRKKKQKRH